MVAPEPAAALLLSSGMAQNAMVVAAPAGSIIPLEATCCGVYMPCAGAAT